GKLAASESATAGTRGFPTRPDRLRGQGGGGGVVGETTRASRLAGKRSTYKETSHDLTGESVYRQTPMDDGLRGSPSLVGRWIANPVRSAPGGSNPPPRADV